MSKINSSAQTFIKSRKVENEEENHVEVEVEKNYPEIKKSMFHAEEMEKEEKKVKNDELLFLKISASALLLVLKRISDLTFLNSQRSSSLAEADDTSAILLLKLKLQLSLFPLAARSSVSNIDFGSDCSAISSSTFHSTGMRSSLTFRECYEKGKNEIDVGDKDKVTLTSETTLRWCYGTGSPHRS